MTATLVQAFGVSSVVSSTSASVTVPSTIPVGALVIVASNRSVPASQTNGCSVSSGSNAFVRRAASARATTHDLSIHTCRVSQQIEAGSTITVTWLAPVNRKAIYVTVWAGVGDPETSSPNATPGLAETHAGSNGSSTSMLTSATAPTTSADSLVVGAMSLAGTGTITATGGSTTAGSVRTSAGSADRGVSVQYQVDSSVGTKTQTATISASLGWAAALITLPVIEAEPEPSPFSGFTLIRYVEPNGLPNPSGEGPGDGGWPSNNTAIYPAEWDTTVKRSGTRSRKCYNTVEGGIVALSLYGVGALNSQPLPVTPGEQIDVFGYVKAGQLGCQGYVNFLFRDAVGNMTPRPPRINVDTDLTVGTNEWARIGTGMVVPEGAVSFHILAVVDRRGGSADPGAIGDHAWADDFYMTRGAPVAAAQRKDSARSVIVGGVKRPVTSASIIVGGVKKSL